MTSSTTVPAHSMNPRNEATSKSALIRGDLLLYLLLAASVGAAWLISRQGLFRAGDRIGYWLGVAGGVMMLLLFTYPLRKYVRALHRFGKVKWWFWGHMALGIGGPLLILLHSTFRIGSLNAGVALYSMVTVALSGVVGRFLYLRVHRGLHGELTTLRELQALARSDQDLTRTRLHFAPAAEARLLAFERRELEAGRGWGTHLRQVLVLPLHQWLVYRACLADIRKRLHEIAALRGDTPKELAWREYQACRLVKHYLNTVVRVAQFTAVERVFALWHVVHVPFVYLLVISALVHVFAVHAY